MHLHSFDMNIKPWNSKHEWNSNFGALIKRLKWKWFTFGFDFELQFASVFRLHVLEIFQESGTRWLRLAWRKHNISNVLFIDETTGSDISNRNCGNWNICTFSQSVKFYPRTGGSFFLLGKELHQHRHLVEGDKEATCRQRLCQWALRSAAL